MAYDTATNKINQNNSNIAINTTDSESATICSYDSDPLTINASNLNSDSACTIGYGNSSLNSNSIYISDAYNTWTSIDSIYDTKEEVNEKLDVLENMFKFTIFLNKDNLGYDRELTEEEFIDMVTIYITKQTKKPNPVVKFIKNGVKETLNIRFEDDNTEFSLTNKKELTPNVFLYYKDKFYIETNELLSMIKLAIFNRLLNV